MQFVLHKKYADDKTKSKNKQAKVGIILIKGVNHQVVEVTKPTCEYFERVIFFVKPEFSQVSEGTLRERAGKIAGETGAPPPTKLKRNRLILLARLALSAVAGAAVALLISRFV